MPHELKQKAFDELFKDLGLCKLPMEIQKIILRNFKEAALMTDPSSLIDSLSIAIWYSDEISQIFVMTWKELNTRMGVEDV